MPSCPWYPDHDVSPDPASVNLHTGGTGMCNVCNLEYIVVAEHPYQLEKRRAWDAANEPAPPPTT
jgi:hypothetical protein